MPAPPLRRPALLLATVLAAGLVSGSAAAAPGATVTSPAEGATVRGTVELDVRAPGAERVDYYVGGELVAYDDTADDFSEDWDTRSVPDGETELVVHVDGEPLSRTVAFTIDNDGVRAEPRAGSSTDAPSARIALPPPPPPLAPPRDDELPRFPECDPEEARVLDVDGPAQFRPEALPRRTVVDARGSAWTREQTDDYPVLLKDLERGRGRTVCWLGGSITSDQDMAAPWDDVWHHTVGFYTDHPYTTIVGLRADNQGDCVAIKDPGDFSHTRLHRVALTNCHDDVVENDLMKNVTITDSVLEGYVLFAFRGGSAGAEDGRNNFWTIDRVIGWLKPQEAVYKGPSPGTGPLFKRPDQDDEQGWEPRFTITDSIFRVDVAPNHGDLSIPPGPHSGNVIVWTGDGPYPGPVPKGFRVTTDLSVWEEARAAWSG